MHLITESAMNQSDKIATIASGESFSYKTLLYASQQFATHLLDGSNDLDGARVAFMVDPGFDYVQVQWGIWQAGAVAVPLCITHPLPSLQYVLEDTGATILVISLQYHDLLAAYALEHSIRLIVVDRVPETAIAVLPNIDPQRNAMILYTSGTTNKPKGVVTTHANIEAQIKSIASAWQYAPTDHALCVLPLHHVHGIINVVSATLSIGGTVEFVTSFSVDDIFSRFLKGDINIFMAVPTIYFKLIAAFELLDEDGRQELKNAMKKFRLMVCGSAALPVSVMQKWEEVSGHVLLERYGMTEIGMGISNPYQGLRKPGSIGMPLPGVSVRLVDENMQPVINGEAGEIQIKGENVFKEYWNKPDATAKEFTSDGWFKTGDVAVVEEGYYRILGRSSVDIIKSGGYKLSALEIEEVLRTHDLVDDCAVVGIADDEWGELVVAAVVAKEGLDRHQLNQWMRTQMPTYKTPRKYLLVKELPRNAMGKVVKNEVKTLFQVL
jgi:malonyl-CoA/methylmalonyl-CoA synthetase